MLTRLPTSRKLPLPTTPPYNKARRQYSGLSEIDSARLIRQLLINPELNDSDARDELKWMQHHIDEATPSTSQALASDLQSMVKLRAGGMPLQYVLGSTDFGPLTLHCRPPTLIPRPETAYTFEILAKELKIQVARQTRPLRVLDLCTGSGAIPLLLGSHLRDDVELWGVDISAKAVELASANARQLDTRLHVWQDDLFSSQFVERALEEMKGVVDFITANPPYITRSEMNELPSSVKDFEDERALLGDLSSATDNGLAFYHRISSLLPALLTAEKRAGPRGVAVEIGYLQSFDVQRILRNTPSGHIERTTCVQDQWGKDRMVVGNGG